MFAPPSSAQNSLTRPVRHARARWKGAAAAIALGVAAVQGHAQDSGGMAPAAPVDGYQSPYAFQFKSPDTDLTSGWSQPPWSSPDQWSTLVPEEWYNREAYRLKTFVNLAYGARSITFPPPAGAETMTAGFKRERVLAAARQLINTRYQHHHIPTFNPYPTDPDWPWIKVGNGIRGPGLDCSNMVSWVYNYALGIRINSDVVTASRGTEVEGPGKRPLPLTVFNKEEGQRFDDFISRLRPADIIYIRSDRGEISHSVLWVGTLAADSNGNDRYFVIDCTGSGHIDSNGVKIPDGVQIRPFREDTWYFRSAAFVHRVIRERTE